ncbi:MAG: hypothetical protein KDB79_12520 [Acidobacteria bacterium]|nr:hypothetical protein [Acidobacteriota bacterium]
MKRVNICLIFILAAIGINAFGFGDSPILKRSIDSKKSKAGLVIVFDEKDHQFSGAEKQLIENIIVSSEKKVRALLPSLPENIKVTLIAIDRNIDIVGGVSGRADAPGEVIIEISKVFPGGITAASKTGLSTTVFHEFHHLSRGWTINGNKFEQGISIAVINEGLAVVFAEIYTGVKQEGNSYTNEAAKWATEILSLPKDANYAEWMFEHPDGRTAIGYRTGNYIIHQAIANSGKTILELSKLSPDEIWKLAGYDGTVKNDSAEAGLPTQ